MVNHIIRFTMRRVSGSVMPRYPIAKTTEAAASSEATPMSFTRWNAEMSTSSSSTPASGRRTIPTKPSTRRIRPSGVGTMPRTNTGIATTSTRLPRPVSAASTGRPVGPAGHPAVSA